VAVAAAEAVAVVPMCLAVQRARKWTVAVVAVTPLEVVAVWPLVVTCCQH
jgi:hypothetical protein